MPPTNQLLYDAVRTILLHVWDPIGVAGFAPDDEYDSYIPGVLALLDQRADASTLAAHLRSIEHERMGLTDRAEGEPRDRAVRALLVLEDGPVRLRFYFDFVSPYAYLEWTQIHRIASAHHAVVEPVPVLFAGLLDAHGTRGPAEVPARRSYLIKDIARLAHHFQVPLDLPPAHPFNSLLALRVASLPMSAGDNRALIDALFAAAWVHGRDLADPGVVADTVTAVGLPAGMLDEAQSAEGKARLRAQTDAAIAESVFGVPTAHARGERFFGCDSLPHLVRHLRGEDPVRTDLVTRWEQLPVGARRAAAKQG